ncbi:nitronate monooxygenase family protein [uncultured Clostridium sp.]|uniref:NAD(P)H-dependent flavin oxidoreductase n=1 Tax=uncultured Clostridium sp. TaxID=59620 RepID=UPI00262F09F3|nr:nitronate monooxygenase family protein [uncultured Clostridium sp.]
MDIKPLKIGNLVAKLPIIQGGMGVGVSLSRLAGAVAKCGGIGVISAAQPGYKELDFEKSNFKANIRALKKHIKIAKENSNGGIIGVNIMVAMTNYSKFVMAAIEGGADLIISGAGLPKELPNIAKEYNIKLAPIVSSIKGARVILKMWDRHSGVAPDMVVVEGPKAGGHLGFKKEEIETSIDCLETEIVGIIEEVKKYEEKYNKEIPVIAAGGVFTGEDIAKFLKLGASGVQMGTRFVGTDECDASDEFKAAYLNSTEDDIRLVKSPVGMPGRGIRNEFIDKSEGLGNIAVKKCYNCLLPCNPKDTPYCISDALINSVNGKISEGLIFCGSNAHRVNKIVPVKELMEELKEGILNS